LELQVSELVRVLKSWGRPPGPKVCTESEQPAAEVVDVLVWNVSPGLRRIALRCAACQGRGCSDEGSGDRIVACEACSGFSHFGLLPEMPVTVPQGSAVKSAMLVARYQAGRMLWHHNDQIGHTKEYERELAHKFVTDDDEDF